MSHSRTGIHGGLRRGSAAAAIGVVLVLSAGVPASQADGGPGSGDPDVRVTGSAELLQIGGLLEGLLGATTVPASPQPTPVPGPTSASPSPVPTTAAPAPTTVSTSPTTSSSSGATGSPQGAAATSGAASVPSPQQPGTAGQPGTPPAGPAAPQTPEALAAEQSAAGQPAAGAEPPAAPQPAASEPSAAASRASGTGTLHAAGGPARGRQEVAPARDAEPVGVSAKVWVGVGLVGSAGAAGLILTRIRRI